MILLVIFCLAVAIWNAYLLFTDRTDALAGWIMLAVSLGVLLWNISAARAYRIPTRTVVAGIVIVALLAMTVSAYAGIEPFVEVKATLVESLAGLTTRYDVEVSPGRSRVIDGWAVSLEGGGWNGATLTVELTVTNLGPRRDFLYYLVCVDSTARVVESKMAGSQYRHAYTGEFYPNESWSGRLVFEMNPYSGKTEVHMRILTAFGPYRYFLFDVGEPSR